MLKLVNKNFIKFFRRLNYFINLKKKNKTRNFNVMLKLHFQKLYKENDVNNEHDKQLR